MRNIPSKLLSPRLVSAIGHCLPCSPACSHTKSIRTGIIPNIQTVASFVKNEYTPTIIHKLDKAVSAELVLLADKLGVNLSVRGT